MRFMAGMRFRVWDREREVYRDTSTVFIGSGGKVWQFYSDNRLTDITSKVDVEFFLGKLSNGGDIFEGDIVAVVGGRGGVVCYDHQARNFYVNLGIAESVPLDLLMHEKCEGTCHDFVRGANSGFVGVYSEDLIVH